MKTITNERLIQLSDEGIICKVSWDERIELARRVLSAEKLLQELAIKARADWLEENDPNDGTDCVSPYDEYLY